MLRKTFLQKHSHRPCVGSIVKHRRYAEQGRAIVFGPPPAAPPAQQVYHPPAHLENRICNALTTSHENLAPHTGLPELIRQYQDRSHHVLEDSLPYEPTPPFGRRVFQPTQTHRATSNGVVLVAHCAAKDQERRSTICSGFAIGSPKSHGKETMILTCAHTLEEIRRSPLLLHDRDTHRSGSYVVSGLEENATQLHPVSSILSALHRADLLLLSVRDCPINTLPVSPYPVPVGTRIRAHFVTNDQPNDLGWKSWIGGSWSKWVEGKIVGYRDYAGREAVPGTYDQLSHMFFEPAPPPGSSGGPIIDEETSTVVGVMLGTIAEDRVRKVRGWGVPAEMIFEMFSLPGLKLRQTHESDD